MSLPKNPDDPISNRFVLKGYVDPSKKQNLTNIRYSINVIDDGEKGKKKGSEVPFHEYNVKQLIKIDECKIEITNLIEELKESKKLVLSKHSIFKSFVYEKLVQEKEEESLAKRDHKHKIRLQLIDDHKFFNGLCRKFRIGIKKKSKIKQYSDLRRKSMETKEDNILNGKSELQSLMKNLRKTNKLKTYEKEVLHARAASKVDVTLDTVKEQQCKQNQKLLQDAYFNNTMQRIITAKSQQNDMLSLSNGSGKTNNYLNITLNKSHNIDGCSSDASQIPIIDKKPLVKKKKSVVRVESFTVSSIVDLLDSPKKADPYKSKFSSNREVAEAFESEKTIEKEIEDEDNFFNTEDSQNNLNLSNKTQAPPKQRHLLRERFGAPRGFKKSTFNINKDPQIHNTTLPSIRNTVRSISISAESRRKINYRRKRLNRSIDFGSSQERTSQHTPSTFSPHNLKNVRRSIDTSIHKARKKMRGRRNLHKSIDLSQILACSDPPAKIRKIKKKNK